MPKRTSELVKGSPKHVFTDRCQRKISMLVSAMLKIVSWEEMKTKGKEQ
jgi:hypothetical protein